MDPVAPAPDAAPVAPAPAAPVAPTPAAPAAPVEAPQTPDAQDTEAQEWDAAAKDLFPNLKTDKQESGKNEQAKPEEGAEAEKKSEVDPNETPEEKAAREAAEAAKTDEAGEEAAKTDDGSNQAARDARLAARQSTEQIKAVSSDIRAKMFASAPTQLQDADGDPISSVEDVMKLIDPLTGESFTEERAAIWLMSAQQDFNKRASEIDQQIKDIADVNITIKDEADIINEKYGELLKSDTDLRDRVWAQFEKTLTRDEESGIITEMRTSLQDFYELTLQPYLDAQKPVESAAPAAPAEPQQTPEQKAQAEAKAKADAAKARQQDLADRSDIYTPPTNPNGDPEADEWDQAAKEVFGNQVK